MVAIKFGSIPFTSLKIVYFKVYDKEGTTPLPFFDATDEQILQLLGKMFHETIIILRIEEIEVENVVTYIPEKKKLDVSELKHSITIEERRVRDEKIEAIKKSVGDGSGTK